MLLYNFIYIIVPKSISTQVLDETMMMTGYIPLKIKPASEINGPIKYVFHTFIKKCYTVHK